MEDKRDVVKFEQLKKIVDKLEEAGMLDNSEISFEFICSSLFPLIYYKIKGEMRHQYDEGVRSMLQECSPIKLDDSVIRSLGYVHKSLESALSELSIAQRKMRNAEISEREEGLKQFNILQNLITHAANNCARMTERN